MKQDSIYRVPFFIMCHPLDGFSTMKSRKTASLKVSFIVFAFFALLNVVRTELMGKQFQIVQNKLINLPLAILSSFVILFVWTLSNWCFCVLMDGKATFKNIWIISVYSLLPYIVIEYINILLGLVITREENVFRSILTVVGIMWSFILIMIAFSEFHEFTLSKAFGSICLTAVGMIIIAVLVFLVYSLFQQLISNILILFNEIMLRIKLAE